ncbi:MAG: hypothetical protein IKM13_07945 [Clostridia bacterium]|nr:hypothetical protein [Clostridia bacterium]
MNRICKRITALFLVLLMTASLLASCSGGGKKEDTLKTIATYDEYVGSLVDLGLSDGEIIMDILEADGELRATIGIENKKLEIDGIEVSHYYGTPYLTERRYYNMSFVEDMRKREKTTSKYEVSLYYDPTVDLVLGGEPFLTPANQAKEPWYEGVEYFFFRDGQKIEGSIVPGAANGNGWKLASYGASAHFMLHDDNIYTGVHFGTGYRKIHINDQILELPEWRVGAPEYQLCGLIGIDGIPYALVRVWENDRSEQVVDTVWEETRLVPLSPEMTELPLEGKKIDGKATGGAFSDGKYGYFMCGSELWRTDGKDSKRIADLIFFGVNESSHVRAVRALSDGRILVATDGILIELSGAEVATGEQKQVVTAGVINLYGDVSELTLTFSKFNRVSENYAFVVKEFDDQTDLNLALLSGEISMVISRDQFMLKNYVKQDILAPLEEVAPELFEKDVLIENIVDATRIDGVCYYLPRSFWIRGESTDARYMEEGVIFESRQDYYNFLSEKVPDYFEPVTKRILFTTFGQDLDEWIDWETNTCHFDDGTFEALLEFCNKGSTQEEVDQYTAQPYSMNSTNFVLQDSLRSNHFTDVKEAKVHLATLSASGEGSTQWVWVDYPIPSSVYDGFEIYVPEFYGVVDDKAGREAAGEFLRWHFLENVIDEFPSKNLYTTITLYPLSVNRDETDRFLARNIDGEIEITEELEGLRAMIEDHNRGCGQEQYDKTWEVISRGDHFQYFRNEVYDVMYEEAGRFFSGSITAEQAAEYVQNRISIYLAEQG